jgi:hypothetical protein
MLNWLMITCIRNRQHLGREETPDGETSTLLSRKDEGIGPASSIASAASRAWFSYCRHGDWGKPLGRRCRSLFPITDLETPALGHWSRPKFRAFTSPLRIMIEPQGFQDRAMCDNCGGI